MHKAEPTGRRGSWTYRRSNSPSVSGLANTHVHTKMLSPSSCFTQALKPLPDDIQDDRARIITVFSAFVPWDFFTEYWLSSVRVHSHRGWWQNSFPMAVGLVAVHFFFKVNNIEKETDFSKITLQCDQHIPFPLPSPVKGLAHRWGEGITQMYKYGCHLTACPPQEGW